MSLPLAAAELVVWVGPRRGEQASVRVGGRYGRQYYDEVCDEEFEIRRPHAWGRLYQYLIRQKSWAGLA